MPNDRVVSWAGLVAAGALAATLAATEAATSEPATISAETMEEGQTLYLVNCRMCHGTRGTAGAPLAGNAKLESAEYVAHTIITGPGYMTPFGDHLDDEQIALVATFVRNSWGNAYGPVSADAVAPLR